MAQSPTASPPVKRFPPGLKSRRETECQPPSSCRRIILRRHGVVTNNIRDLAVPLFKEAWTQTETTLQDPKVNWYNRQNWLRFI